MAYPCPDFTKDHKETRSIRLTYLGLRKKKHISLKNDMPPRDKITKVIKGEFEKLETIRINDLLLTCNTSLEIFNKEFNRLSRIDDDLFTYKVEIAGIANIPCDLNEEDKSKQWMSHESDDDMEYNPSKFRGNDETELTAEESSAFDYEDEVAQIFRIETNVFDYETPLSEKFKEFNYLLKIDPDLFTNDIKGFKTYEDYKDDWIYEWNKDIPWMHEKPWMDNGTWEEPKPVKHECKPFNYKTGCSKWPTCNWRNDGYYNGGKLPGAYIVGNSLHYQDYEWYEALEDSKLKDKALRNKAIMEGIIDDNESSYKGWRSRYDYEDSNHDHEEREYMDEHDEHDKDDEERELCDDATRELPVCEIKRYIMIKYSFGDDEKYVAIKEDEYNDFASTNEEACRAYQEIFQMMDEGWMVTKNE
ncbi:hypothetical protein Tco_0543336 [Tanacetum coccineum]